jgi:simple sugar transport system permease protein
MASVAAPPVVAAPRALPGWLTNGLAQIGALLLAFVIALALGAVIVVLYGENPLDVYAAIFKFSFTITDGPAYVMAVATPLIFSALAVSICFKAGLFNIGVEGQFLVGMLTAAWAALYLDFIPGPLLMWTVLLFASLGGMAYAAIPAVLKVKTGAHEVVTTIMLNGIAVSLVGWALNGPLKFTNPPPGQNVDLRTDPFPRNALVPDLGHVFGFGKGPNLSWLFPLAIVAAIIIWFVVKRMRLGFEARAVGAAAGSARAGGISIGGVQIKLFLISGALAGLVGMQQILADQGLLPKNYIAQLGFTGIAVAFLGRNNPIGIIFAALIWGILARGETALQIETDVPREFVIILQGLLILTVVITYELAKRRLARRQVRTAAAEELIVTVESAPEEVPT